MSRVWQEEYPVKLTIWQLPRGPQWDRSKNTKKQQNEQFIVYVVTIFKKDGLWHVEFSREPIAHIFAEHQRQDAWQAVRGRYFTVLARGEGPDLRQTLDSTQCTYLANTMPVPREDIDTYKRSVLPVTYYHSPVQRFTTSVAEAIVNLKRGAQFAWGSTRPRKAGLLDEAINEAGAVSGKYEYAPLTPPSIKLPMLLVVYDPEAHRISYRYDQSSFDNWRDLLAALGFKSNSPKYYKIVDALVHSMISLRNQIKNDWAQGHAAVHELQVPVEEFDNIRLGSTEDYLGAIGKLRKSIAKEPTLRKSQKLLDFYDAYPWSYNPRLEDITANNAWRIRNRPDVRGDLVKQLPTQDEIILARNMPDFFTLKNPRTLSEVFSLAKEEEE